MAKKKGKSVPLNSQEALAHLSAGLGGIPIRYGSGPSVTAVPDRANDPKRKVSQMTDEEYEKFNNELAEKYPPNTLPIGIPLGQAKGKDRF